MKPEPQTVLVEGALAYPLNRGTRDRTFHTWVNGFSPEELAKVQALGEAAPATPGVVGAPGEGRVDDIRACKVSWISRDVGSAWLFDRVAHIMAELNRDAFGLDLWGFLDGLQYTVYDSSNGPEHYGWHVDMTGAGRMPRKLSFVLQLSNPMDYDGGDLKLHGMTSHVAIKERGLVYVFPAYTLHQVTPVTRGIRRSLVAWAVGPEFR